MTKKNITEELVELTAAEGMVMINGSSYGRQVTTHISQVDKWREGYESDIPIEPQIDYDEEVNSLIRERYTESQEFAILRQRDTKPEEYKAYNDYCEECKMKVKSKML